MKSFGVTSALLPTLVLASLSAGVAQVPPVLQPSELCTDQSDAAIATFEDADLEARVRSALPPLRAQDDLTCRLVSGLTRLDAERAGIASLVGLQNLTSLTELYLPFNLITDISPLSRLTSLTVLNLRRNSITDISGLSELTSLTILNLRRNSITDISALSGLTSLTELYLPFNSITDISPLSGLTSLTVLNLRRNSITDISPLSGLTSLTELYLPFNSIADISPLSGLTGLTDLGLYGNSIADISPLNRLTSLTDLDLGGNSITDISALSGLTSLTDVALPHNPGVTDFQPLLGNAGRGAGGTVDLRFTGVRCADVAALRAKGVSVLCLPRMALFNTSEQPIRVVIVTKGLSHPWGMAFLPDGGILVTERAGRLRLIRDGVLDPEPVPGVPEVLREGNALLLDIALHPRFVDNHLVYLAYGTPGDDGATIALARGRFDGTALRDVRDIFVADPLPWGGVGETGSRIVFAPDGTLYMTLGGAFGGFGPLAQDPSAHAGKVLRLRDDGTVPDDNPFVGRAGYKPEIFSLGHRNQEGAAIHPETGALWASEHGPQGGDEVNVILAGRNYGWPEVSYGRWYEGPRISEQPWQAGMEEPVIVWLPSIAPSGMTFYTGDRFPGWEGNLFVGGMQTGQMPGTGHLERIVLNADGEELGREWLLGEFKQRIRDVRQGPDGLLYVLTEEDAAALFRIEPVR